MLNIQAPWACKPSQLLHDYLQICQLRADASEKERDFRTKQQNQQKAHTEQLEQLKVSTDNCTITSLLMLYLFQSEIRNLRTQLSKVSQKKASNASDKQSSSFASIASSLAATPMSNATNSS